MLGDSPFSRELLESPPRVLVSHVYRTMTSIDGSPRGKSKTPYGFKSIAEVPELIKEAIEHFQTRESTRSENQIFFTVESPDFERNIEAITYGVVKRTPGGLGAGSPFSQPSKELRPSLREEYTDPDNPGYSRAVLGQWFDNLIRLTCWSHTSRQAEKRANWLERIVTEYRWWFVMKGLNRFYFWEREEDEMKEVNGNKVYGKPLLFFVRTEKLSYVSEKKLEQLIVQLSIGKTDS